MDWIRRNWPDLLIGLALLAVIGGIIATLLNGGNFLPTSRNVTVTDPSSPTVSSGGNTSTTETIISPALPSGTATISGENGAETTGTITPVDVSATTPETAIEATVTDAATEAVEGAVEDTVETATDVATTGDATTGDAATSSEPIAASSSEASPYRISVGAFGSVENAERRAETFRSAGYPVFVGKQGDLSLVLIGPFESQAAAQQAATQIQNSGLEANPIIYEFTPADAETEATADTATTQTTTESAAVDTTSTEPTETDTATSEAATAATESTTVALPTSNTGRYLQVGAYGSVESAQPQLVKLQGLGFSVTYIEESEKIKLLVGPYEGATLETAKAQLTAQGIDHFVR
jgi:cell division septation protein DedD